MFECGARAGYDELTWNHISCRVSAQLDEASAFLITPGDKMYVQQR